MTRIELRLWNLERVIAEGEQASLRFDEGFVWLVHDANRATGVRRDLIEQIELMENVS